MRFPHPCAAALAAVLAASAGAPPPVQAQTAATPEDCQRLVSDDPARGLEAAREWERFGGGSPAVICKVLALEALGALSTAAVELQELAREAPAEEFDSLARAALLELAAGFHLRDGNAEAAAQTAEAGLALAPSDGALHLRRAEAMEALGRTGEALDSAERAVADGQDGAEALLMRSRLRLAEGEAPGAAQDAAAVLAKDSASARGWLAQGRAQAAMGERDAARESLLRAVSLDRGGDAGAAAQTALQQMDAPGG